jgi:hypothetical protein
VLAYFAYGAHLSQPPAELALYYDAAAIQGERTMQHGARFRAEHYRDMAAHFRSLAEIEPLANVRRYLHRLAAQYDEAATDLEMPQASDQGEARAALG